MVLMTYVALGPVLITISLGMAEGYSAILLPQLKEDNNYLIDDTAESWIASITALPMPIACVLGGMSMELIGRKTIHMVCCFLCIIGWLLLYFAINYASILSGRFITGFCVGLLGPPTGVYLAETSEPKFRGFLLALISVAIALGVTLAHILGTYLSYKTVALVCCIFPVIAFLTMLAAPESPTYLAKKRKNSQAREAFYWCRGQGLDAENELAVILLRQNSVTKQPLGFRQIQVYFKPEFFKPLAIILVFFFTSQWCGSNAITFYNIKILQLAFQGDVNEYSAMIAMDFVRLVCSILACFLLKMLGRRPLAIISCAGTLFSLLLLSCSLYLNKIDLLVNGNLVVLVAFILYMGFLTIGLVPLPWTMTGEIFPVVSRGMGSGLSALTNYAFIFSVVKTTPWLFSTLDTHGAFFLYACMCFVGLIILAIFLPETKDKPLHVIEDHYKKKADNHQG